MLKCDSLQGSILHWVWEGIYMKITNVKVDMFDFISKNYCYYVQMLKCAEKNRPIFYDKLY